MSLPFENALQRERERQRRQREGGQHTELSTRMNTLTLSPTDVGSPFAPPLPSLHSHLTDRALERTHLEQENEFIISYPVNGADAMNLFSLPPVHRTSTPISSFCPPPHGERGCGGDQARARARGRI